MTSSRQYRLHFADERTELLSHYRKGPGPVFVDFLSSATRYRIAHGGGRGESVARAVGLRQGVSGLTVLDATAGLGGDAVVLAGAGCTVHMLERHPVVFALLSDGLQRARIDANREAFVDRLHLHYGSLLDDTINREWGAPDVVYLDPMFPERKKSSQVKKEMQTFHDVVGGDDDADVLLQRARLLPVSRVVVKRPRVAPFLGGVAPGSSLEGKRCRYDLYALRKLGP